MDFVAFQHELAGLLPVIGGVLGGAILLYLAVTMLTACSVPGMLIPMSVTGGLLLGPVLAVATVATGALTGSLLLFTMTRRFGAERLRRRFGDRLAPLEDRLASYGPYAVVVLRVVGAPGPLITAGASLTAMRRSAFALATLIGLLPSVVLAAAGPGLLFG